VVFVNHYEHSLDAKGRIVLPAKFRHQLGEKVFLGPLDGSLGVYSEAAYMELAHRLQDQVRNGELDPMVRRGFAAMTVEVELDNAGRITIPSRLREFAQLIDEVVVNGAFDYIEIWNRPAFEAMRSELDAAVLEQFKDGGTIN